MPRFLGLVFFSAVLLLLTGCATPRHSPLSHANQTISIHRAALPAGTVEFELFLPSTRERAPLLVVAHGFARSRRNMRGWGEHLSQQGFVVAIPNLPSFANHSNNADAIVQLIDNICRDEKIGARIDAERIGVIGFSSGGLATFLAASRSDRIDVWVGLDPVDRREQAVAAAGKVKCAVVALLAEPADCNKNANWLAVKYPADVQSETKVIPSSIHTDCESPTDALAEIACGKPDPARTKLFLEAATVALRRHLVNTTQKPLANR